MDSVYEYFSQNIERVSKEEILTALGNALLSANYWRDACLLGYPSVHSPSKGWVGIESDYNAKIKPKS